MERSQIDALIDRIDLVQLAQDAGAQLHKNGGGWRGACPLHGGKNPTAFSIFRGDDGRMAWKCFTADCGGGDALSFVMKWKGLRFPEAIRFVGGEALTREQEVQIAIERAERAARLAEDAAAEARQAIDALKQTEVWLRYHQQQTDESRAMWTERGIPETFQTIWKLGFCPQKTYETRQGRLTSPSITIPIFTYGWDVLNVKHRLLNPLDPNDKYRPEKSGLSMPAFICDPDTPKDKAENILIIEGEIKAMVTYLTLDSSKWQVIGIPGKDAKKIKSGLVEDYRGRNCIICLDPDGRKQSEELAKQIEGRMFLLPSKIDDMILSGQLNKDTLRGIMRQSYKV